MKVTVSVVGQHPRPEITWPEGWPVPRVGDEAEVAGSLLHVRHVCWYPQGDDEDPEPFVYVVIGPRRPQ